jgi:hypothetical protein
LSERGRRARIGTKKRASVVVQASRLLNGQQAGRLHHKKDADKMPALRQEASGAA